MLRLAIIVCGCCYLMGSVQAGRAEDGTSTVNARSSHPAGQAAPMLVRVGAAAEPLRCDASMPLAGMLEPRFTDQQEGELRATAIVIAPADHAAKSSSHLVFVSCDVLFVPRDLVDAALQEIEQSVGISTSHVLVHATHTHHAPSLTRVHGYAPDERFRNEVRRAIVAAVQQAERSIGDEPVALYFGLGAERTVGGNSRFRLPDGNISWINPASEAGQPRIPTGPFDPQLPVLDFRTARGESRAILFAHSTHTIGTIAGEVRSPSFYGLAAQKLEQELGAPVAFFEGASGSTHNVDHVPVEEAVARFQRAVLEARRAATVQSVSELASRKRSFAFRVRHFDEATAEHDVARYTTRYLGAGSDRVREIFRVMRQQLQSQQGEWRHTVLQATCLGDVAIVGVPAEFFTHLGMDIKRRSPFPHTVVVELANDWIGYLPDREAHYLGGYQTWMGFHSYAEPGTGERVVNEVVDMLNQLAASRSVPTVADSASTSPAPSVAAPRLPSDEQRSFQLADAQLTVELVAAEPMVESPVAMAWDAAGSLYVAAMVGYPEHRRRSRICRLVDVHGDGSYDNVQTFADQLNFPTSVLPWRDGILVTDAPDLIYLWDEDGDGQADRREVIVTGFGEGSQQLRANSLHLGLDGWIYGANGRCDGALRFADQRAEQAVSIRGRDFRIHLGMRRIEAINGQSQFGMVHDDLGNRFLSWNTIPIRHAAISDFGLRKLPSRAPQAILTIAAPEDTGEIFSRSPPPLQFNTESARYYNAMCGLAIQRGDGIGPDYRGNAFVCESLSNLITRRRLVPQGATFVAHRPELNDEFLTSSDPWFHPVNIVTGPDGCLYVADFYRQFVEHPIYVADSSTRRSIDWSNGAAHGRIWRVRRRDFAIPPDRQQPRLAQRSNVELVAYLSHSVAWWRETAQRLICEREANDVAPLLRDQLVSQAVPLGRLHALATLRGLNSVQAEDVRVALHDREAMVRWLALSILEDHPDWCAGLERELLAELSDIDPRARLEATWLSGLLPQELAVPALAGQLEVDDADVWQWRAAFCGRRVEEIHSILMLLPPLATRKVSAWPVQRRIAVHLLAGQTIADASAADETQPLLAAWLAEHEQHPEPLNRAAMLGLFSRVEPLASSDARNMIVAVLRRESVASRTKLFDGLREDAIRRELPVDFRLASIQAMAWSINEINADQYRDVLLQLWREEHPVELRDALLRVASVWTNDSIVNSVYANWETLPPAARRRWLQLSLANQRSIGALLDALERRQVSPQEVPTEVVTQLKSTANVAVRERATTLLALNAARRGVAEASRAAMALTGSVQRGGEIFRDNCLQCHQIRQRGGHIGPDLSAIASRSAEALLTDVLDPNRNVSPDFVAYTAVSESGETISGLLVGETATTATLRTADGRDVTLSLASIEQMTARGQSLMPEGFDLKFNAQQLADLIAFLLRPDPRWLMIESSEATTRGERRCTRLQGERLLSSSRRRWGGRFARAANY